MEQIDAIRAFATLGQTGRLSVFRLLMRFAPRGVRPTEIAQSLSLKPNTLSHYLSELTACGLVTKAREGRSLYYSVDITRARALIDYLALDLGRARPDLLPHLQRTTPMSKSAFNVLFICSGNSARSIFAEALMRDLGKGHFTAYSAGLHPNSQLNPFALDVLARNGHATDDMRSKHISEFQTSDAPVMDFVFTVCDTSAAEECPPWPGQPLTGHWGLPDPVKATGTDAEKALVFARTYGALRRRIAAFVELPFSSLSRLSLQQQIDQLGQTADLKDTTQ
jgi:protein-tyrosine-phosphatase/DNA-binding transcriptional ArsR family regulator